MGLRSLDNKTNNLMENFLGADPGGYSLWALGLSEDRVHFWHLPAGLDIVWWDWLGLAGIRFTWLQQKAAHWRSPVYTLHSCLLVAILLNLKQEALPGGGCCC